MYISKIDEVLHVGLAATSVPTSSEKLPIWGKTCEEVPSNATGWLASISVQIQQLGN
jgi:hypothetical protein